jgi:hypothetical protein
MIFAPRGTGKTYLAMSMAHAIATGTPFLSYSVPVARRVLYVDGELPAVDLQMRVRAICGENPTSNLELLPSEFFFQAEKSPLNLNSPLNQERFFLLLEELENKQRKPDVIFFDNLSSMSFGIDENSNSEQDLFLQFLLKLRHQGYSIIFIHHTGKDGNQRGASRREDFLDLSIKLDPPPEANSSTAKFTLKFSKIRRKKPAIDNLDCELTEIDGKLVWTFATTSPKSSSMLRRQRLLNAIFENKPKTQSQLATILGITKGTISKNIKELLVHIGFVQLAPLGLTLDGIAFYEATKEKMKTTQD